MVTTSFRDDDEVLNQASKLWDEDDSPFADKSDFYRFARDFALTEIFEEYEPKYDGFGQRIDELDNIEDADEIIARASSDYFEAFDYATSMKGILEDDEVGQEERIEAALERTYDFILSEFSDTYVAKDLK
jgi:hypothetical protein